MVADHTMSIKSSEDCNVKSKVDLKMENGFLRIK